MEIPFPDHAQSSQRFLPGVLTSGEPWGQQWAGENTSVCETWQNKRASLAENKAEQGLALIARYHRALSVPHNPPVPCPGRIFSGMFDRRVLFRQSF